LGDLQNSWVSLLCFGKQMPIILKPIRNNKIYRVQK
jgi:hypothetical protein